MIDRSESTESRGKEPRLYLVPLIGIGTEDDPIRPDVPVGTSWAGNALDSETYLIATHADLEARRGVASVERSKAAVDAATSRKAAMSYDDVVSWSVRGGS